MPVTLKKFITGGINEEDSHNEVLQLKDGNSFFMEDPKKLILKSLWESLDGIPGIPIDKDTLSEFLYGNITSLTFHPSTITEDSILPCRIQILKEHGVERKMYENTVTLKRDKDENVEVSIFADFGAYHVTETYVPFHIPKEDVCYLPVGNIYRGMKYGNTKTIATHESFSSQGEALSWFEKSRPVLEKEFSSYAVEVFSRRHLENTSWYLDSEIFFEYYENLVKNSTKKNLNEEEEERDF